MVDDLEFIMSLSKEEMEEFISCLEVVYNEVEKEREEINNEE